MAAEDPLGGVLARAVAARANRAPRSMSAPTLQRFYARDEAGRIAWKPDPADPTRWRDSGDTTHWLWWAYPVYEAFDPPPAAAVTPTPTSVQLTPPPGEVPVDLPQLGGSTALAGGALLDALLDYRAAKARAFAEYAAARKAPPAVVADPLVATDSVLAAPATETGAPGFDAAAATRVLDAVPPGTASEVHAYLGHASEALVAAGFEWDDPAHLAHVRTALETVLKRARETALAQAAAAAQADQARIARFDPKDPDTWKLNELEYANAISQADVGAAADGAGIVLTVARATLRANGPGGRIPICTGARFHTHLQSGSWGLAFAYVVEADRTVTPYVYDIATSREGNVYKWRKGAKSSGNSNAEVPGPKSQAT